MKSRAEGTGSDLQSALDDAIANALDASSKSSKKTDSMIKWKLLEVTGETGGLASLKSVTVKIEYEA